MKLDIYGEMKDVRLDGEFYIVKEDGNDYKIVPMKYEDAARELERRNQKNKFDYRLVKHEGSEKPFVVEYFEFGRKSGEERFATEKSAMSILIFDMKAVVRKHLADIADLDAWAERRGAEWKVAKLRQQKK